MSKETWVKTKEAILEEFYTFLSTDLYKGLSISDTAIPKFKKQLSKTLDQYAKTLVEEVVGEELEWSEELMESVVDTDTCITAHNGLRNSIIERANKYIGNK